MHVLGVIVAAVAGFILGGLWYSPMLFANAWARESGTSTEHNPDPKVQARFFTILLVLLMLAASVLNYALANWSPARDVVHGVSMGALGGALALSVVGMDTLFERKGVGLFLINAGYYLITFSVMGTILGVL